MCTPSTPSTTVLVTNVIPDQIVVSVDGFDALDALLTNKLAGNAVNLQPVGLGKCCFEEVGASV